MIRLATKIRSRHRRRGFTLLEAIIASTILLGIVTAVTGAIVAGQQNSLAARERIAASFAAEALMGRILCGTYDNIASWHGHREDPGTMVDEMDQPLPESFGTIGRSVLVETTLNSVDTLGVYVRGRTITVRAFNTNDETLVTLQRFVPEPSS